MDGRILDYFALGVLICVVLTIIYVVLYIHDIPYEIAKKRNHPHQDAIHTAGWVSLFLMHTIWPFLWIWATLYRPERGWGMLPGSSDSQASPAGAEGLMERVSSLEQQNLSADWAEQSQVAELARRMDKLEKQLQEQKEA